MLLGFLLFALVPLAVEVSPLVILALMDLLLTAMIFYETINYGERRQEVRQQLAAEPPPS